MIADFIAYATWWELAVTAASLAACVYIVIDLIVNPSPPYTGGDDFNPW
jgi:hypothetical protein